MAKRISRHAPEFQNIRKGLGFTMGMLDYLLEKKHQAKALLHPFVNASEHFKELYCFGVGIISLGHMNAIEETESAFYRLLHDIGLPASYRDTVIVEINHNLDYWLEEVLQALDTKEKQYCFTIDLYRTVQKTLWAASYCTDILAGYQKAFHFSKKERDFFYHFMDCAEKNSLQEAISYYKFFELEGHVISYGFLKYAYPDFDMTVTYDKLILSQGEEFVLDKNTVLNGNIELSNGSTLVLQDALLTINGCILIHGGTLNILRSKIQVTGCPEDYLILCEETAGIELNDLTLSANGHCGFLSQTSGSLVIQNSIFQDAKNHTGLFFHGHSMELSDSGFYNCGQGAVHTGQRSSLMVSNCSFNLCHADYGGAVYSDSLCDCQIERCHFKECSARYLGACVYFKNKKYGQKVSSCSIEDCNPSENPVFNAYPSEDYRKEKL